VRNSTCLLCTERRLAVCWKRVYQRGSWVLNNSRRSIARWLLPGILLLTSGCFRPAGEAAVPTSGAAVSQFDSVQSTPTELPLDGASPTTETGDIPAITLVAPEDLTATAGAVPLDTVPTELPSDAVTTDETTVPAEGNTVAITPLAPDEVIGQDAGSGETIITPVVTSVPGEAPSETPTPLTTFVIATPTPSQQFITPSGPEGPVVINTMPPDTAPLTGDTSAPTDANPVAPDTAASSGSGDRCTYTVQSGDNLYRIALENDVSLEAMRQANPNLTGENPVLMVGQELFLPECGDQAAPEPTAPASVGPTVAPTAVEGEVYTVRPGDTLSTIAQRNGVTVNDLIRANNLTNPDRLNVGQQLIIPSGE
jgi:LysM repeat protein